MTVSIRSDEVQSIADLVARAVLSQTGGRIQDLVVEFVGRELILSGRTSTYYVKQLATHAALDYASHFATLTNDLEVV